MIDPDHLRLEIIRPVLKHLDPVIPFSYAAENLLMGTCAQESRMGQFLVQLGDGPAKGIFQMEPTTHDDIWENFLSYRESHIGLIQDLCVVNNTIGSELTGNLYYACAMARVHYYRVPMALPLADNVEEIAHYWKLYYNTPEGKGTVAEFIHNYNKFVK